MGHGAKRKRMYMQIIHFMYSVLSSFKFVVINIAKRVETKYFTGKENKQERLSLKLLFLNSSEKENGAKIKLNEQ
jgi:hypothetical protein